MATSAAEYAAPVVASLAARDASDAAALLVRMRHALQDRYDVLREIGRGGMAVVFLARDRRLAREVAIKVLRDDGARLASAERFRREIAIVAGLQHPHIVPLYEADVRDGLEYFVMPYVQGETLRDRLRREPALSRGDVAAVVHALASALDHAHALGVVHRDVKPENVLLLDDGQTLLADFGIALTRDRDTGSGTELTEPGGAPGTRRYMSPEQARGECPLGPATDVYSLATVACEMLAGTLAAPSSPPDAAVTRLPWRRQPAGARAWFSEPVRTVLARAQAADPATRYATAGEFAAALGQALSDDGTRRAWWITASLMTVAAVAATALGLVWLPPPSPPPPPPRVVAVLPLATKVPVALRERQLGEALVQPLAMQLDASTELRVVDHAAVLLASRARSPSLTDAQLAGSLGATDYVTGSVVGIGGDRIAIFLTLRPVDGSARNEVSVEANGDADQLIELVDSLSRRLLVGIVPTPYREAASIAERTTHSNEALLAYLEGERHYRARRYDSATVLFNRAIDADSTFALAMHRLRVAHSGTPVAGPTPGALRQRTLRHAARLPPRQQRHVLGFDAFIMGRPFEAESIYTQLLAAYPHDVEALYFLADAQIHYMANWGMPLDTPRATLHRLLRVDPSHAQAIEHLAMIAGIQMQSARTDSLLARLEPLEQGEYRLVTRAVRAFRHGSAGAKQRALEELDTLPSALLHMAAHRGGGNYPSHLVGRIQIAELLTRAHRAPAERASGYLMIAELELARGRIAAADAARAAAARISPDALLDGMLRAFIAPPTFDVRSPREIAAARTLVESALRSGARDSVRQRFLLGVLDARLGDLVGAARHADVLGQWAERIAADAERLTRADPEAAAARLRRSARLASLAVSLRADVERRRGNFTAALALLREWHPERWWTFATHDQVRAQPYERRLMAEMLEATGQYDEAVRWYEVWHGPLIGGTAYMPGGRLRMARLLEARLGRPGEAMDAYANVLDAWSDADPALWPLREQARVAHARLSRVESTGSPHARNPAW